MSQRKTLKKGVRPEITIVSAQPMSSTGSQDITYFSKSSNSPKVQAIDHNQALVLGVDLPHPPRSAPPPRPADPSGKKISVEKPPRPVPVKPAPPILQPQTISRPAHSPVLRPAPPKPVGPKRSQSLGKHSDLKQFGISELKRDMARQTPDISETTVHPVNRKKTPPKKPPRPKSEVIHTTWTGPIPIEDTDELVHRTGSSPAGVLVENEDHGLHEYQPFTNVETGGLSNGTLNGILDSGESSGSLDFIAESPKNEESSPKLGQSKKSARPTIITAASRLPVKRQEPVEESLEQDNHAEANVTDLQPIPVEAGELVDSPVANGSLMVEACVSVDTNTAIGGVSHEDMEQHNAGTAPQASRPPKPPLPSRKIVSDKKEKPVLPAKPKIGPTVVAPTGEAESPQQLIGSTIAINGGPIIAGNGVPNLHQASSQEATGSPAMTTSGAFKKAASLDQGNIGASQMPYSSHPERGMRNRAQTAPKVPAKPRRTKSLHRRPSISPPSTPPPPPREEVEMLLSGSNIVNTFEFYENGADATLDDSRQARPVPPERISSIDSYDNKMSMPGRGSSLHGSGGLPLDGIKEDTDQGEIRRKPVRPAPPKPIRSQSINVGRSNGSMSAPVDIETCGVEDTSPSSSHHEGSPVDGHVAENGHTYTVEGGIRNSLCSSGEDDDHSKSPEIVKRVAGPVRPAPPRPSFPPHRHHLGYDAPSCNQSPISVGEPSGELKTDIVRDQGFGRGSVRNPQRPAPPRPSHLVRHKSMSEADYTKSSGYNAGQHADEAHRGPTHGRVKLKSRSQSVRIPGNIAPRHERKSGSFVLSSPLGADISHKTAPPPRPSLPTKNASHAHTPLSSGVGSSVSSDWTDAVAEPVLERQRSGSSGLMEKIQKNMEVTGPHAVALFDFQSQEDNDLSFEAGDVILLKERVDFDWLRGTLDDVTGIFPANFVEVIIDIDPALCDSYQKKPDLKVDGVDITQPHALALQSYLPSSEGELGFEAGETIALLAKEGDLYRGTLRGVSGLFPASFVAVLKPLPSLENGDKEVSLPPTKNGIGSVLCIALFNYDAENPQDLSFQEGNVIEIIEKINEDWYRGELNGAIGMFPAAFVKMADEPSTNEATTTRLEDAVEINVIEGGLCPQARGLFDFQAMDSGELSFKAGDVIILRRRLEDDWYEGEIHGQIGCFPAGFVEVLTPLPLD